MCSLLCSRSAVVCRASSPACCSAWLPARRSRNAIKNASVACWLLPPPPTSYRRHAYILPPRSCPLAKPKKYPQRHRTRLLRYRQMSSSCPCCPVRSAVSSVQIHIHPTPSPSRNDSPLARASGSRIPRLCGSVLCRAYTHWQGNDTSPAVGSVR